MNEQISHLEEASDGSLKGIRFFDTPSSRAPRDPDATIKINAVEYAGILNLIGKQARTIQEMKQDIRWAVAFGFLGCAISIIALTNVILK